MAKKVITTKRCPCCGYEYQITETHKDETIDEKIVVSKMKDGKNLASYDEVMLARIKVNTTGVLKGQLAKVCEVITKKSTREIFYSSVVTKGTEPFEVIKDSFDPDPVFGGPPQKVVNIIESCPKCGVLVKTAKCTTTTEEKIE